MPPPEGALRGIRRALPLSRDRGPAEGDRRHARRHGVGPADGPAHLRRCRLRQDRGGAARRLRRRDVGHAGRGGGADDLAGAPAFPHLQRALRRLAGARRAALAPGQRARRGRDQEGRRRGPHRYRRRHACAARQDRITLPASGPARRRRGAAFRRGAEGAAEAAEGQCPCADADRDADPAHAAAGACRRARDERHRHAAGRPPGGAHLRHARTIPWWCARRSCASIIAAGRCFYVAPRISDLADVREDLQEHGARDQGRRGARQDGAERARRRHERLRRGQLRSAALHQHHRIRPRHSDAPTR